MSNDKRGIGDNSLQEEQYKSLADVLKDAGEKLWNVRNLINEAKDTHTASHGDKYYFKYEVSDREFERANTLRIMPKEGVERRPNPYEKKEFAGETTNKLTETAVQLTKLAMEAEKLEKKLSKKDKVGNAE